MNVELVAPDRKIWSAYGADWWPTVLLIDPDGKLIGGRAGEANFDAKEIPRLIGRSTRELARELGPEYEREVVHRDDLVILHS